MPIPFIKIKDSQKIEIEIVSAINQRIPNLGST
jgi:hypothetical protein